MRKLKDISLKTPFHIALFRMKLRSHWTLYSVEYEIRANLFLEISKTEMCLLTLSLFQTFYYFGSQLAKGLVEKS